MSRIRVDTPTTPPTPTSGPATPTSPTSSGREVKRKTWKPIMPSILSKMRNSVRHSVVPAWNPEKSPESPPVPDRQSLEREDDERLFARLKAGYPCEDVKHILAVAAKHYRDLDEHIDFAHAWVREVCVWRDTVTTLPALPTSQRARALALHAQVDMYLTLANMLALEHARTGAQLKVAEELLHHGRLWINLGRDRTHKRFEDFERAADEDRWSQGGRRESSGGGRRESSGDSGDGGRRRRSFSRLRRSRDDVAANLEQIATFLNELTSAESRLPHLHNRLGRALDRLAETQEDVDGMVRSIAVAKEMIERVLDGLAWRSLPPRSLGATAATGAREQNDHPPTTTQMIEPSNVPSTIHNDKRPPSSASHISEYSHDEVSQILDPHTPQKRDSCDPFHLDDVPL